jgi:hypothetical protein
MGHIAIHLEKTTNDLDDDCTLCKFIWLARYVP